MLCVQSTGPSVRKDAEPRSLVSVSQLSDRQAVQGSAPAGTNSQAGQESVKQTVLVADCKTTARRVRKAASHTRMRIYKMSVCFCVCT